MVVGVSTGTHYLVRYTNGDGTLDYFLTPTASSDNKTSVNVQVTVSDISIVNAGALQQADGTDTSLTGQMVKSQFRCGSFEVEDSSVQWNIDVDDPCCSGEIWGDGSPPSSHHWTYSGIPPFETEIVPVYWLAAINKTITCSATIDFPDGSRGSVSAKQLLQVVGPVPFSMEAVQLGHTYYDGGRSLPTSYESGTPGIMTSFYATTPDLFLSSEGSGYFAGAQLCEINWIVTYNTLAWDSYSESQYVLDTDFPYTEIFPALPGTGSPPNQSAEDVPDVPMVAYQLTFTTSVSVADQFEMSVIFDPPPNGSAPLWIPARELPWFWCSSASKQGPSWPPPDGDPESDPTIDYTWEDFQWDSVYHK